MNFSMSIQTKGAILDRFKTAISLMQSLWNENY